MKQNKTRIKELRQELHYYQEMVRVDLRAVRAGIRKCKELGEQMRALQNGQATQHRLQSDVRHCGACGMEIPSEMDLNCRWCGARLGARR